MTEPAVPFGTAFCFTFRSGMSFVFARIARDPCSGCLEMRNAHCNCQLQCCTFDSEAPMQPVPDIQSVTMTFIGGFLAQSVVYFAVASAIFLLIWRLGRIRLAAFRIPAPNRFNAKQLRREILHTLGTLLVGTLSATTVLVLNAAGIARLSDAPVSILAITLWVMGGLIFNDAWFYFWHRLLHHPLLFRHIHAVHHKSVDVNPFTSYSFHVLEAFILGAWILPAAIFLPIPIAALTTLQVVGLANNLMAHLGYDFLPRWILKVPILRWTNTATFHSLHHTRSRGNFGLHSRVWDRLFGTEISDYEQVFLERGAPAKKVGLS